jgi:hypothetical protein
MCFSVLLGIGALGATDRSHAMNRIYVITNSDRQRSHQEFRICKQRDNAVNEWMFYIL